MSEEGIVGERDQQGRAPFAEHPLAGDRVDTDPVEGSVEIPAIHTTAAHAKGPTLCRGECGTAQGGRQRDSRAGRHATC